MQEGSRAVCLGDVQRAPGISACGVQTVIHFPCIIGKSYFHFLCGHHIPVLRPCYAPSAPHRHFFLLQRPDEQEPGALPLTSVSKDYTPCPLPFWKVARMQQEGCPQSCTISQAKLNGKSSLEVTIFVHALLPQLPLHVSVSALLTVILVQDGHISSMS